MRISLKIKINSGPKKGQIVTIDNVSIEYFDTQSIVDLLIDGKHLDCWVNDNEFEVIERVIESSGTVLPNNFGFKMEVYKVNV